MRNWVVGVGVGAVLGTLLVVPVAGQDLTTSLVRFFDQIRAGFLTLPPKTADPTGMTEGAIYYNDTSNSLKVYNGTTWGGVGLSSLTETTALLDVLDTSGATTIARFDRNNGGLNSVTFGVNFGANAATPDVGLRRAAAGVVEITNGGATGTSAFVRPGTTAFASLGTPANGALTYCSDCTIANPCASGGTGALAKRLNSVWVCN